MNHTIVNTVSSRIDYEFAQLVNPALGEEVSGFERLPWQPYPQRQGKRLSAPAIGRAALSGFTDIVEADDDLYAIITHWPSNSAQVMANWAETVPEQYGYLYIGLEGDGCIEVEGLGRARQPGPHCSVTIAPPASTHVWRTGPGVARRGACIAFHTRHLRRRYPDLLARCGGTLGPWLNNSETQMRDFEIPLLPLMSAATSALLSSRLEGESRLSFVSATVEQLLCLAMAALAERSASMPGLSARDRQIVQRVRAAMDENLADPPRLEDLAKKFGINRNKLRFGFKALFGTSAAEYLFEQRMRAAFELLECERYSVTEVSARVGYSHLCNFTTAFKRRFGRTPGKTA